MERSDRGDERLMARLMGRWKRAAAGLVAFAAAAAIGGPAQAIPFGPLPLVPPSALVAGGSAPLTGSISLDVAAVPVAAPTLLRLTSVAVSGGGASIALDPALANPALGVVQASGSFLIPTLFLRVDDGVAPFDLAVPNVTGTLFFGPGGSVVGLASSFEIDGGALGIVTANVLAGVPEPGTALLVALGLGALTRAARSPRGKEIA